MTGAQDVSSLLKSQSTKLSELTASHQSSEETSISFSPSTWRERVSLCYTLPHLAALLSLLTLSIVVVHRLRVEAYRHKEAALLAERCGFTYLVSVNHTSLSDLGHSLKSFNSHFVPLPYKILILHDGLPPVDQGKLQSLSEAPLQFRFLQHIVNRTKHNISLQGPENMIYFWSYLALRQNDYLEDIDFLIRLEPSAVFTRRIRSDFVLSFVAHGLQYAYPSLHRDCSPNVTQSLKELAVSYVGLNGIQPRNVPLWNTILTSHAKSCIPYFNNHFEIINLRFFRTHSGIQDWIRAIETHGGIFHNGWHDGLLRYVTVALYAAPSKTAKYGTDRVPISPTRRRK
ncbi:hypothetical protein BWQ96_09481 [Gracilariopsis chorda]|uniref:Uncharacterized protein n=1 Tax=Gracilariopsis chorda TaxID=448386 RepID=A0A2V3IFL3_9FLOR|nr:hypothetical protein BWQ96_09481 [Gracilariopsis chorda]|eukprot:PXF40823.1 hypothetical protein BWQ96_09481 [Gracilariopsis chorda]